MKNVLLDRQLRRPRRAIERQTEGSTKKQPYLCAPEKREYQRNEKEVMCSKKGEI